MKTIPNVYKNGEITVSYSPSVCINSERCAKEMSQVFRNSVIPWINLDGASTDAIIKQVRRCPSGALKCSKNKQVA